MSLEVCVLASGSSGNCTIVRTPAGVLAIDAGISPRSVAQRLGGTGVRLADISHICLTHLDSDHFSYSWVRHAIDQGVVVYCHRRRMIEILARANEPAFANCLEPFDDDGFDIFPGLTVFPISLMHDHAGSHGFVLEGFDRRVGYATDLGYVPPALLNSFLDLDVLALESNYDPWMQEQSSRPWFLKRRITGGRGHLSNEQAFEAVGRILDRAQRRPAGMPTHIVLLHRSRECNCPKLLQRMFSRDARIAPRLTLAEPYSRTQWLNAPGRRPLTGEQLMLAW